MSENFAHLNAQPFLLEAGDSALLLIHGFTGTPSHMRLIGEAVQQAGFTARGILLPGHGQSLDAMRKSNDRQWHEACRAAFEDLRKKYRRVSVAGLSMGGILSTLLAEEFDPACLILFAPALKYRNSINYLSPVAKRVMPSLKWPPSDGYEGFRRDYDFGYDAAPVDKVEDMTRLQKKARSALNQITCPTLVIQSHKDEQVHDTVPEIVTRGVSSQVREICWVDRSTHVCTIGPDTDYVCARVIDFLQRYAV